MNKKIIRLVSLLAILATMSACKPDKIEAEIYTSDIQKSLAGSIVEVPLTVSFSMMGDDKKGDLEKASNAAKKYLDDKAEFKMSKNDWGDVMVVKFNVPIGTEAALKTYLSSKNRPFAFTVVGSSIMLEATPYLKELNQDLEAINMMLNVDIPAKSTVVRIVGDLEEAPEVTAIAVFVDNKAELIFQKKIERRSTVNLDYKGEDASVYSQIRPHFTLKF